MLKPLLRMAFMTLILFLLTGYAQAFRLNVSMNTEPHQWPPFIHWDLREMPKCCVPYSFTGGTVPSYMAEWFDEVKKAFQSWENVEPAEICFVNQRLPFGEHPIVPNSDNINMIDWGSGLGVGMLAMTYTWSNSSSGRMWEADILFNDNYNWIIGPNNIALSQIDVQSVSAHEIGHFIGLDHSEIEHSGPPVPPDGRTPTMTQGIGPDFDGNMNKRTLETDDRRGCNFLYTPDIGDAPDLPYPSKVHGPLPGRELNHLPLNTIADGAEHIFGTKPWCGVEDHFIYEWLGYNVNGECESWQINLDPFDDGVTFSFPVPGWLRITATVNTAADADGNTHKYNGDDKQMAPIGPVAPGGVIVAPGPNGSLETSPQGDDIVAIVEPFAGGDGIANTLAAAGTDDVQVVAVGGTILPGGVIVAPGPNGRLETSPQGDDIVAIVEPLVGGNSIPETMANNRQLYLNIWVDWNCDGNWDDSSEHVVGSGEIVTPAVVPGRQVFNFWVPVPLLACPCTWVRARLDWGEDCGVVTNIDPTLAGPRGAAQFGEVEDYEIKLPDAPCERWYLYKPNGGETIPSGSIYTIQWCAGTDVVKVKLLYSLNNGISWKKIASNVTRRIYDWTVPAPTNNKRGCLIKVIGYNAIGEKIHEDTSAATFTIEVVKVTSPNGGEILKSGNTHTITWITNTTKNPVAEVIMSYTDNGGATWNPIITLTGNPGSYNWALPSVGVKKNKCKVRMVLKDASNTTVGSDKSDNFFTISP